MASTILLRTIGGVDDKRIVLSNSNFARPFSIPSGWNVLRIAIRCIWGNTGANLTSTPKFYLGLCSGSSNIVMDATTTHFVGAYTNSATWTYVGGPPVRYGAMNLPGMKRVGAVITDTGANLVASGWQCYANPAAANRFCFFLDITKGSPNYTLQMTAFRNSIGDTDILYADYIAQANLTVPTLVNHTAGTARTLAVDEGVDGTLNHVNIGWDRITPTAEICDLALVKLS